MDVWKCISVLKGEEISADNRLFSMTADNKSADQVSLGSGSSNVATAGKKTASYYKLSSTTTVSHPNQYPWH